MAPTISRYILDKVTAELFDSGNHRQALRNTDKKLKKTPTSVHLLTLKALLLCELEQYEESKIICSRLTAQKPPVSASDEVAFLFVTICHLGRRGHRIKAQEVDSLWRNAIVQRQSKTDQRVLGKQWADLSIREADWTSFSKAAAQLQKLSERTSQDHRRYAFWEVVGLYTASLRVENPKERQIAEKLSLRKIELSAGTGHENLDSMTALANWVETSEEQIFTQRLVVSHANSFSDKIKFLSPALDFSSQKSVAGASLERIELCEDVQLASGDFEQAYELAFNVLNNIQESGVEYLSDNWHNLRTLCDSAIKLKNPEQIQRLIGQLKDKFAVGPVSSRGIREAHLFLISRYKHAFSSESMNGTMEESASLKAFKEHFKDYATYAWGIESILNQFFALDKYERLQARKHMTEYAEDIKPGPDDSEGSQLKWITAECKCLHLDLEIIKRDIASGSESSRTTRDASILTDYVVNCIQLYKTSRCYTAKLANAETSPGNKACLLAVEALLVLSIRTKKQVYTIQAAFLLECATRDSGDRDLKIKQIAVLKNLGLSSLALNAYKQLNIRNVLCDSMCPVYFARVGTMLPSADPKKDLYQVLEKALSFYKTSLSKITKFQQLALSDQNYQSIVNMEIFKKSLIESLTRRALTYEGRRIGRLTGITSEGSLLDEYNIAADVKCIESFNCKVPYSGTGFSGGGPLITNDYVRWLTILDHIHDNIRSKELREFTFDSLDVLESSSLLTSPERSSCRFATLSINVLQRISGKSTENESATLTDLLEELHEYINQTQKKCLDRAIAGEDTESETFFGFEYIHETSMLAEALQSAWSLADKVISATKVQVALKKDDPKKINNSAKKIQQKAIEGMKDIKEDATKRKKKLEQVTSDTNSVLELAKLFGDEKECKTGDAILKLVGERWIKQDFRRLAQSAKVALDAVIAFKAPGA